MQICSPKPFKKPNWQVHFFTSKTHSYNLWVGMLLHWSYDFRSDPERSHILHSQGWPICSLWGLVIIMAQTCFLTRLWFFFPVKKIEWIQVKISYEQSCLLSVLRPCSRMLSERRRRRRRRNGVKSFNKNKLVGAHGRRPLWSPCVKSRSQN